MKKQRKITYLNAPKPEKKISFASSVDETDSKKPIFCFEEISQKYSDKDVKLVKDKENSHSFLQRIEKLSNFTWDDLKKQSHRKYGYEMLSFGSIKGCEWMKKNLRANGFDKVMVFRVENDGISRILGVRQGQVFKIFCYDNAGVLYDHGS